MHVTVSHVAAMFTRIQNSGTEVGSSTVKRLETKFTESFLSIIQNTFVVETHVREKAVYSLIFLLPDNYKRVFFFKYVNIKNNYKPPVQIYLNIFPFFGGPILCCIPADI